MLVRNNVNQSSPDSERQTGSTLGSRERAMQPTPPLTTSRVPTPHRTTPASTQRRRVLGIMSALLLIIFILAGVRLAALASAGNDELLVRVGNQQVVTLDLRQSLPISPDLLGTNVFPLSGTRSADNAQGFMDYSPPLTAGLTDAHITLLRFPGGKWGEEHSLSLDQLSAFSTLLQETHADGMVQAQLSGPIQGNSSDLTDVASRAAVAGRWVDFLNNPRSDQRTGKYAHAPFHPVKYWTVGDEPDTLINPATGQKYLVKDYVNDFIQFSTLMHKIDPHIQVFGPDISEFYGPGAQGGGPGDAQGQLWMEGFLQGVGTYERAHNVVLLDGVSFHRYQFVDATQTPYLFLSSTGEWNYLLPALHQLIGQDLKRDVPIAITEINTNQAQQATTRVSTPARGLAALWWADTLGTLMNSQVAYVAFASASDMDTPYPLFTTYDQQPTPMFQVMDLFSHLQHNLIPLEVQRDPVSVYATQDAAHQAVSLLFINKSSTPQLAQIRGAKNSFGSSSWNSLDVSLAGYAMVVITLHRTGNAEAYSFIAPAGNDSSTAPVMHTLCGHKTDPLATTIPC